MDEEVTQKSFLLVATRIHFARPVNDRRQQLNGSLLEITISHMYHTILIESEASTVP